MLKKIAEKLFGRQSAKSSSDGFFLNVRCNRCDEIFNLYVYKSYDLFPNYHENGSVTYRLKKEIIGGACPNKIQVKMEFDGAKRLISKKIEAGDFID